ncbi:hypothetical protein TNCV_951461 [Trichonephila clavipes]|nr:hypothetical protein TNCV_951461 [Trichonephila clavipes]
MRARAYCAHPIIRDHWALRYSSNLSFKNLPQAAFQTYKCSTCYREFSQKGNLQRHEELHKEVRQMYTCRFCPKAFARKDNLKCHEKVQHMMTSSLRKAMQ